MAPRISLICAIGTNRAMGKNNDLLWHLPDDLKRFRRITVGHPVVMGLKTFGSIGKPLPDRTNIVVSDKGEEIFGCEVCNSIESALRSARKKDKDEIFIIGGGMVFSQTLSLADRLYLTVIDDAPSADTFFPDYSSFRKKISEELGSYNGLNYKYLILEK